MCIRDRTVAETGCSWEQTVAVFLDVEKEFDRVWHPGLLYKLTEILLRDCYTHLIASFRRNRTFYVRVDNTLSSERDVYKRQVTGRMLK